MSGVESVSVLTSSSRWARVFRCVFRAVRFRVFVLGFWFSGCTRAMSVVGFLRVRRVCCSTSVFIRASGFTSVASAIRFLCVVSVFIVIGGRIRSSVAVRFAEGFFVGVFVLRGLW